MAEQPSVVVGPQVTERRAWSANGFLGVVVLLAAGAAFLAALSRLGPDVDRGQVIGVGVVLLVAGLVALWVITSLAVVAPGETLVLQFFGQYVGTVHRTGLTWLLPLVTRRRVSVRVRNFETGVLKVNDATGNPIEIAAIVVWQTADPARSVFAVEDADAFIRAQADAAVRHIARTYPYDAADDVESLRGSTEDVVRQMSAELDEQVSVAGLRILQVRIAHLAYAPEIAQAMLQRQQAAALIAARSQIVAGAVGMVRMALTELDAQGLVTLDEERKAAMVSNLLVVLCGDARVSPVVNTGTLYT